MKGHKKQNIYDISEKTVEETMSIRSTEQLWQIIVMVKTIIITNYVVDKILECSDNSTRYKHRFMDFAQSLKVSDTA